MKKVSPQEGGCVLSEFSGITGLVREEGGSLHAHSHSLQKEVPKEGPRCRLAASTHGQGAAASFLGLPRIRALLRAFLVITTYFFLCYCQNTTINLSRSLKAKHG